MDFNVSQIAGAVDGAGKLASRFCHQLFEGGHRLICEWY